MKNKKIIEKLSYFRSSVHLIEKGNIPDERKNYTIKMFKELENYLSVSEKDWVNRVLFGRIDTEYNYDGLCDTKDCFYNIARRRSVREFNAPVPINIFVSMVDAANYAPSSCNRQPMEYVLIYEIQKIMTLGKIKKQKFIEKVPSVILALCNTSVYFKQKQNIPYFMFMDSGVSIQTLIIAGQYNDIGTCIVNVSLNESIEIKKLCNIPEEFRVSAIIPCGTYLKKVYTPGRKDLKEMIHYEKWGGQFNE